MTKQYFHAFVIGNHKLHDGALHLAFRCDNEDYYLKKFKRTSHTCHYIELPCGMSKDEAVAWIKQEFALNETYQAACNFVAPRKARTNPAEPKTPQDRLAAIRDRILAYKANMQRLEQEEQEVMQLLEIFQDK